MFIEKVLLEPGHYIVTEDDPQRSRDEAKITFANGVDFLQPGTVLALVTGTDVPSDIDVAAEVVAGSENVGDAALAVTAFDDDAGPITVTFTSATAFTVTDSLGTVLGDGLIADNAEEFGGITINLSAGTTAPAAGDTYTVTIPRQDRGDYVFERGTYVQLVPGGANGTGTAAAILYSAAFANESGSAPITARDTAVKLQNLQWPEGITLNQRNAAIQSLAGKGIISRATTIPVGRP